MAKLSRLFTNLFRRERVELELDEEVRGYVEMLTDEKVAAGQSRAEARREALIELGGVEQVKEEVRGVRAGMLIEQFWQDVRYGARVLAKNPAFTLIAVVTIALGIGVNASIFSVFNSVALRPLQLPGSYRLVDVYQVLHGKVARNMFGGVNLISYPEFEEYRDNSEVFSGFAAYKPESHVTLSIGRQEIIGQLATCNYFDVVETKPAIGRFFAPSECATAGSGAVVVLSHDLWANTFSSDPQIVGKVIRLNRVPVTVIGVADPVFHGTSIIPAQFWAPITMATVIERARFSQDILSSADTGWLAAIGRLKDGVTVQQARANLSVIASRIDQKTPGRVTELSVNTATLFGRPDMRTVAFSVGAVALVAVGLVLLIACANIANLMLARAAGRSREIAVRLAVGASRGRLIRQLLTESFLIALTGGVLGMIVSVWTEPTLVRMLLARIPAGGPWFTIGNSPDVRVLTYSLLLTVLTGMAFGLAPALQATRPDVNLALKDEAAQSDGKLGRNWLRGALVGGQVAVCMVLLVAAGLLLRGLYHAQTVDPGFEMTHVGTVNYNAARDGYTLERATAFNRDMVVRLRSLPGVEDAVIVASAPLSGRRHSGHFLKPGHSEKTELEFNLIGSHFFSLVGIPLVRGRAFTEAEISSDSALAIVSESAARKLWPGEDPIGKQLMPSWRNKVTYEIVGVAKDVQLSQLGDTHTPYLFLPASSADQLEVSTVMLRTHGPFAESAATIRAAAQSLDTDMKIDVMPLKNNLDMWTTVSEICVILAAAIGLLGLLLASIGIYGTAAYTVTRRVREIGIRMALGARAGDVKALVLRQAMRPVVFGAAVGLLLCAAVSRILSRLLFGISPLDAVAFASVAAFLLGVSLLASYLPARRAVRVDPMVALRHD